MGDFFFGERFRNDTDHAAAFGKAGVGNGAHKPDIASAVDEGDAALGEEFAQLLRSGPIRWTLAVIRATENAEGVDHGFDCIESRVPSTESERRSRGGNAWPGRG